MKGACRQFLHATHHTEHCQRVYLKQLLQRNQSSEYGIKFSFDKITSAEAFQQSIPLTHYEDYLPYIEKISNQQNAILTHDPVILFEPTSGSSSASKYIPYTNSLKQEFQQAIHPWIFSLFRENPTLYRSRSYWSISPKLNEERRYNQLRVGFENDSDYLGTLGKYCHHRVCVSDSSLSTPQDLNTFRNMTLILLLEASDLGFISIWHPTFLTLLLDHFHANQEVILEKLYVKNIARYRFVKKCLRESPGRLFQEIWPQLKVISCWQDGNSTGATRELMTYFPDVYFQRKGLIATEGVVSFPLEPYPEPILAIRSHFYEFIDQSDGNIRFAHQLEKGKYYSVVITTAGGFYRYQLKDIVEITGFMHSAPTMRFVGKEESTIDLFGEKLNEAFVGECLKDLFAQYQMNPSFHIISPMKKAGGSAAYVLFLVEEKLSDEQAQQFIHKLDNKLRENFHYHYCRKLGQLAPIRLFRIREKAEEIYWGKKFEQKIRLGDIKTPLLDKCEYWQDIFNGYFID